MGNLAIKRFFTLIMHSPDEVEIRNGVWNTTSFSLKDDHQKGILAEIVRSLDGNFSALEIAKNLNCKRKEVEDVIDYLDQLGILEDGPGSALDYYLDTIVPTLMGSETQAEKKVILLGSSVLTQQLRKLLESSESNIKISEITELPTQVYENGGEWRFDGLKNTLMLEQFKSFSDSFLIGAFSSIDTLAFEAVNRASIEYGFPWLHLAVDGPMIIVGPLFTPSKGPCYECFEKRVSLNLRNHASYVDYKNALTEKRIKNGVVPIDGILANLAASHAALEALNFLNTGQSFTYGKALCIYIPTMEFSYNEVLRLPGCHACGSLTELEDTELYFDVRNIFNES